jgi:ribosomal protein L37AE/L43A
VKQIKETVCCKCGTKYVSKEERVIYGCVWCKASPEGLDKSDIQDHDTLKTPSKGSKNDLEA